MTSYVQNNHKGLVIVVRVGTIYCDILIMMYPCSLLSIVLIVQVHSFLFRLHIVVSLIVLYLLYNALPCILL